MKKLADCIVCNLPYNDTFYDKGNMGNAKLNGGNRYLCSKACYSAWFDIWQKQGVLDNKQKIAQRKRCLDYYYAHQDKYKNDYKLRYKLKNVSVLGV